MLALVWMVLTTAGQANPQSILPPPLQPTVYHSPSKQFALLVQPSERDGAGHAEYRLTRDGKEVWTGELPFTFREAVVRDDGEIGGAALSGGYRAHGHIVFAVVDAKGTPRWRSEQERYSDGAIHGGSEPILRGVHTQGDGSTITLRLTSSSWSPRHELWWAHDWVSGELLFNGSPYHPGIPDRNRHSTLEAQAIPGTPLAVSLWRGPMERNHVLLTPPRGEAGRELVLARSKPALELPEGGSVRILAVGNGQFELGLTVPTPSRVTYRVQREEQPDSTESRWQVHEVGREPWIAEPPPVEPPAATLARNALELLGEIHLDFAALDPKPGSALQPLGWVRHRTVDLQGRIYLSDHAATVVYVFEPNGAGRCVARPEPLDLEQSLGFAWLAATDTGRIALGKTHHSRIVEFDDACERIGVVDLPHSTGRWSFVPGSTRRWVQVRFEEVQLVDSDGRLLERVRKRPDGDWLEDLHSFAVAPVGSLALVTKHAAFFYDENGKAINTVVVPLQGVKDPASLLWLDVAYDGEQLWLKRGTSLLRLPASGAPPSFADLHTDAIGSMFLGARAEELLVFTAERERVLRFALPREGR